MSGDARVAEICGIDGHVGGGGELREVGGHDVDAIAGSELWSIDLETGGGSEDPAEGRELLGDLRPSTGDQNPRAARGSK